MVPAVQKELGLDSATSGKITNKYMSSMQEMARPSASVQSRSPKEMQAGLEARMKRMRKIQQECLAMLTPAQKARLKQITVQQLGATALLNPEVKKAVGIDAAQEKKIGEIVRDGSMKMFSGMNSNNSRSSSQADIQKRMQEFAKKREAGQKKMLADSLKVLKPDQQAKWKALQGKPFKFDMMRGFAPSTPRKID